MSKEDIFEELKSLRIMIEGGFYDDESELVDRVAEMIWEVGKDIGEF